MGAARICITSHAEITSKGGICLIFFGITGYDMRGGVEHRSDGFEELGTSRGVWRWGVCLYRGELGEEIGCVYTYEQSVALRVEEVWIRGIHGVHIANISEEGMEIFDNRVFLPQLILT